MCLIVDTGCLPEVFNEDHSDHADFAPVKKWIRDGDGTLVYGCKKYFDELKKMPKYVKVLIELKKNGSAERVNSDRVDPIFEDLKEILNNTSCDDEHLVALVKATGVKVACVVDGGAQNYLQDKRLYHSPTDRPKIYSDSGHDHLLSEDYIAPYCS